jgi:hypothetical protein
VIEIVSQHGLGRVQEFGDGFGGLLAVDYFLEEVGVAAARGFDEEFLGGCALFLGIREILTGSEGGDVGGGGRGTRWMDG